MLGTLLFLAGILVHYATVIAYSACSNPFGEFTTGLPFLAAALLVLSLSIRFLVSNVPHFVDASGAAHHEQTLSCWLFNYSQRSAVRSHHRIYTFNNDQV